MKKLLFCLMAAGAITACKKETNEKDVIEVQSDSTEVVSAKAMAPTVDCENDSIIKSFQAAADRPEWLRANGHLICENNLYECIDKFHDIETRSNFDALAGAHAENRHGIKYYTKKWRDVRNFIAGVNCYEKYLGFTFSGSTMNFKLLNNFTTSETCYSIPFLKSISQNQGLADADVFMFAKAMVPRTSGSTTVLEEKVIFLVKKGTVTTYFDLSDNPMNPI